ncbi:Mannose-6-phosphate isomerase [Acididesulfobacillus acetoxydans]|uniref:Phosphohexomutase n=1 Tax=Acididesulfobacillus acetoxydans TaxID=1561005 RepID=A0A8S0VVT8_9FIRM|nr:type I phosphomannose isomerase catalytic subunit [Acididesulfobacillus acetoxydans]CAA7600113.1 Mannose-6-phosphate isomerase [Acididesulfobacillus acetoxydans]CEJ07643.1 Mannose-6-phosphate isomerase ManA [Acididesulfobacillus acetoxydans]
MYPLKFLPVYKERVWGGHNLARLLGRKLPKDKIGESWDLCCHQNGMSIVANGHLRGKTLAELMAEYKEELMGKAYDPAGYFPLLIKIIDANNKLSVQVHPDDEYAHEVEGEPGKAEAWYVIEAKPDAKIVYGLKDEVSRENFRQAVRTGEIMACLREVPVKQGDIIYIPSGLIHALLAGVLVYEVQQNSDTTYRVYDYGRLDKDGKLRELHIENALDVINFSGQEDTHFDKDMIDSPYFQMERIRIDNERSDKLNDSFLIYCIIGGKGGIAYHGGIEAINKGETVLVPASLKEVTVRGNLELLRICI